MNNTFSSIKFSGFIAGFALAAGLCASVSGAQLKNAPLYPIPAQYSDKQLTPGTNPSAAIGMDLLLAEEANGPGAHGAKAETWTTVLNMSDKKSDTGAVVPDVPPLTDVFDGAGPTGTYAAGTIGSGKHTEDTLADIHQYTVPGSGLVMYYQYVVTDTNYSGDGVHSQTNTIILQVGTYSS